MNTQRETITPEQASEQLGAWFTDSFTQLTTLTKNLCQGLRLNQNNKLETSVRAKTEMKNAAEHFLAKHPIVDGCGLIFAHSALGTKNGRLEWWVREDESRFARYSFGVAPGADRYYDYEKHEWFIRAFQEGQSSAVGPFIDYLGVEVYIMTLTMPAQLGKHRIGAVGADIQLADLERQLLPTLLACNTETALLGGSGNVLLTNTPQLLPGETLQSAGVTPLETLPLNRVPGGLSLVTL